MLPGILTYLAFLPAAAALFILLEKHEKFVRALTLMVTLTEFAVSVALYSVYYRDFGTRVGWYLYVDRPWVPSFGMHYALGLDGISLVMVMLTAFLFVLSVLISWRSVTQRVTLFHAMLLFLETGVMGVFLATDLFLFYLFWEAMLIPMFFLIGIWGHGRRTYSALKFFIFTVTGSLLMLLAIIGIYVIHGQNTGDYTFKLDALIGTQVAPGMALLLFAGFFAGFAVKIPVFPIHTWLPDAHTDAPTAGSVLLAGLLLKTGAYGLIRFAFPLFPGAAKAFLPAIFAIGVIGIFYASWIAFAQSDMKRLVAYSSVSHLAYVVIGIAAWNEVTLAGSVLQMVNHGITTGALFIMVGMLDERSHTRELGSFGGLWSRAPMLSAFFWLFVLSSLGLPGLNNFAGEFLILTGLFRAHPYIAAAAFAGLVFTLIYLLRLGQRVLFGPMGPASSAPDFHDLSGRELAIVIPLAVLVIAIGVHPEFLLKPLQGPVWELMAVMRTASVNGGVP